MISLAERESFKVCTDWHVDWLTFQYDTHHVIYYFQRVNGQIGKRSNVEFDISFASFQIEHEPEEIFPVSSMLLGTTLGR